MRPSPPTCLLLPRSSSLCARSEPPRMPDGRSSQPPTLVGPSYWETWWCNGLEWGGGAEHRRLGERWRQPLHPHGESVVAGPERNRQRGMTGEVRRDREHIVQVHGEWIGLGTEREGGGRRRRSRRRSNDS